MAKSTVLDEETQRQAFIAKQNARKDGPIIFQPFEIPNNYYLRRPSGITQLDIDTGGGAPSGGATVIAGPDNAGKTMLLFHYYAMCQRIYGERSKILHCPVEGPTDYWFLRKCGYVVQIPKDEIDAYDEKRQRRGLPKFTKEERAEFNRQIGYFDQLRHPVGEVLFDGVEDAVEANFYHIIGVDSLQATQSAAEAACESLTQSPQQAADANMLTRFYKRYFELVFPRPGERKITSLILISQVRSNRKKTEAPSFMAKYLPDFVATGAYAMRHAKLLEIMLTPGQKVRKGKGEEAEILGKLIRWNITKGKAGTHDNILGEIEFSYDEMLDITSDLYAEALKRGLVSENKGEVLLRRAHGGEPLAKFPTIKATIEALAGDIELNIDLRMEVLAKEGVEKCVYR